MTRPCVAAILRGGYVALIAGIGIAMSGSAHSASGRFELHASLTPAPPVQSSAGLALHARLSAQRNLVAGGGYSLSASVAAPLVCTSDTIFLDGFDP